MLEATRAAGALLPGGRPGVARGVFAHAVVSAGWTVVLSLLDLKRPIRDGIIAGVAIAALDLEVIGRHYPAIRALPRGAQWADHVAFGILVAVSLGRRPVAGRR
ncbi:hypothetical protein [Amycolatopsis jejuensis]|uniref:hypothetical protein n=1 Tax=Amycolatopsis jejuensis TaxID=330084 RepID=UPI001FE0B20A|nr:hypothetical protein [Amycolatopsis jejuensis]